MKNFSEHENVSYEIVRYTAEPCVFEQVWPQGSFDNTDFPDNYPLQFFLSVQIRALQLHSPFSTHKLICIKTKDILIYSL